MKCEMKKFLKVALAILVVSGTYFFIVAEDNNELKGTYKSSNGDGKNIVLITVDNEANTFVEYIDQREVDRGSIIKVDDNVYKFKSDKQEFETTLKNNDSFNILIENINGKEPINIKKSTDVKQYFSTVFGDEKEYKELISSI